MGGLENKPRTSSSSTVSASESTPILNKNVNWMNDSPGFYVFYLLLLLAIWAILPWFFLPSKYAATGVSIIHGVVSFLIMHWIKGSPDENCSEECRELTFYEQIDDGAPWTDVKKFLMLVPTLIFLSASVSTDYDTAQLVINFPIWAVLILAKLPEFHRVRIFGINSTMGIDDEETKKSL